MKPHIHKIVGILITLTILMISGAKAQTATRAHVPFNFNVNNATISAGDCIISRANDGAIIVRSLAKNGGLALVISQHSGKTDSSGSGKWLFRRYGDTYFFAGMSMPEYALTVLPSKTEKSLRKELGMASASTNHPSPIRPEVLAINVTN